MELPVINHPDYVAKINDDNKFPIKKFGALAKHLLEKGVVKKFHIPKECSFETLKTSHSIEYINHIKNKTLDLKAQKKIGFPINDSVVKRSFVATGGTVLASKFALESKLACNTAGGSHHATFDYGAGYCVFNDTAVAANYLKNKGYRVIGLGWQAHLKDWKILSLNRDKLNFLSELIDWTHNNNMEFHITEIDYAIDEVPPSETSLNRQANGYANILKVLISKMNNGVLTYNTWGIVDKIDHLGRDQNKFLFDKTYKPKPVLFLLRETLETKNTNLVILD